MPSISASGVTADSTPRPEPNLDEN